METQANRAETVELQKKLDKAVADNQTLAERVEKMEAQTRRERYVAKVGLYKYIPGFLPEDFGVILAKIDGALNEQERATFDKMLGATNAALRQNAIYQEYGRTGEREGSEPAAKLQKIAKSIQDADPKMTFPAAYAEALKRNPGVYDEYAVEKSQNGRA